MKKLSAAIALLVIILTTLSGTAAADVPQVTPEPAPITVGGNSPS